MGSYHTFYSGADWELQKGYGMNSDYNHGFIGYQAPASSLGFPSDPTTANQLNAVSKKISTGTKTVEVSGINIMGGGGPSKLLDVIPKQHMKEINRLKQLTGIDLTFHGPMVEPTGAKQGWTESDREMVETEIWSAVQRGHQLDPDGNIVITFHSSNGLPDPQEVVKGKDGKEKLSSFWIIDERKGRFDQMNIHEDYFKGKPVKVIENKIKEEVEKMNEEQWVKQVQSVSQHVFQGHRIIEDALSSKIKEEGSEKFSNKNLPKLYKLYLEGKEQDIKKAVGDELGEEVIDKLREMTHGDLYLRDSYQSFKELFNLAYDNALKKDDDKTKKVLDSFREEIAPKMEKLEKDPSMIAELSEELIKGVNLLRSIEAPQVIRSVRDFAIDKSSDSFANVAFKAYKEFGNTAPIISIENPPAGSGLHRAEDLKELVKESQRKFVMQAKESGMSESEAKKIADKLIGVTWDVGHINMIKKFGYDDTDLEAETKKVAPYIKHVHLSDNFGIEHTELPMGMGNVPVESELKIIHSELKKKYGDKMKEIKKIVETGDWFSRSGLQLQTTPFQESLAAFGSPIYSSGGPVWNEQRGMMGDYFGGRGLNPDIHHQTFGGGYTNQIPLGLGEPLPGQGGGRSRFAGTPME